MAIRRAFRYWNRKRRRVLQDFTDYESLIDEPHDLDRTPRFMLPANIEIGVSSENGIAENGVRIDIGDQQFTLPAISVGNIRLLGWFEEEQPLSVTILTGAPGQVRIYCYNEWRKPFLIAGFTGRDLIPNTLVWAMQDLTWDSNTLVWNQ